MNEGPYAGVWIPLIWRLKDPWIMHIESHKVELWKWNRFTKSASFLAIRDNVIPLDKLARLYLNRIVARHGIPALIICDRDGRFTSNFWRSFQKALGTDISIALRIIQKNGRVLKGCKCQGSTKVRVRRSEAESDGSSRLGINYAQCPHLGKGSDGSVSWGKLNPCYVRTFKVLAKVGKVAYRLGNFLKEFEQSSPTVHVSNLKKC
ncbi:putative reverse transcriptase domain-containing protein [Tanacetum coccineum]